MNTESWTAAQIKALIEKLSNDWDYATKGGKKEIERTIARLQKELAKRTK